MTPYRMKGSRVYWLTLTRANKTYRRLSSETRDEPTARAMQEMLVSLSRRGSRSWDIIEALDVPAKERKKIAGQKLTVAIVFDYYTHDRLDELRAKLADVDLAPTVDLWEKEIKRTVVPTTYRSYAVQVAHLFPKDGEGKRLPFMRSQIQPGWLKLKLGAIGGSNTNRRHYAAAWRSVFAYLVEAGVLDENPMHPVTVPKQNPSTTPHIRGLDAILRFINEHPAGPHRALAAFRHGAGVEASVARKVRMRDIVDFENRIVWAHGTKNTHRDRQVIVEPWAWSIITAYIRERGFLPDAYLWYVGKKQHHAAHHEAARVLRSQGFDIPERYTLHAARHTYGVFKMSEGADPVLIANNFGHANTSMVLKLYGKFRPAVTDIIRADRRARGAEK